MHQNRTGWQNAHELALSHVSTLALPQGTKGISKAWPFMAGAGAAAAGCVAAPAAAPAAEVVNTPHGNHGDNLSMSGVGGKNDQA